MSSRPRRIPDPTEVWSPFDRGWRFAVVLGSAGVLGVILLELLAVAAGMLM